jgi:hypothetical protein
MTTSTTRTATGSTSDRRGGGVPPPPSLGGDALRFSCALAVYKPPPQQIFSKLLSLSLFTSLVTGAQAPPGARALPGVGRPSYATQCNISLQWRGKPLGWTGQLSQRNDCAERGCGLRPVVQNDRPAPESCWTSEAMFLGNLPPPPSRPRRLHRAPPGTSAPPL